jgi:hypothetical protein
LWQKAAVAYLQARPMLRDEPLGIATDEAILHFLRHTDWRARGARPGASLPDGAQCLLFEGKRRGSKKRHYEKLETPWGDLYLDRNVPAFFRPVA